jgi:outer membrane autotransporter protein
LAFFRGIFIKRRITMKYAANNPRAGGDSSCPVHGDDVFELPSAKRRRALRRVDLLIGASLALLPAFLPMQAEATDLYVSGGGGGTGSGGPGDSGPHAGKAARSAGGAAYVGDGTNSAGDSTDGTQGNSAVAGIGLVENIPPEWKATAENGHIYNSHEDFRGGSASLSVQGDISGYDRIFISGGAGGQASSGHTGFRGGAASFIVTGSLSVSELVLTKARDGNSSVCSGCPLEHAGPLTVDVGTLDVTTQNTILTLDRTLTGTNADSVIFHTIELGGGRFLTVNALNGGAFDFETLNVRGANAHYAGNLDATGRALNFYLPDTMKAGETMLGVSNNANITNSTVNVGINGASSPLQPGDAVVLIDADTLTGEPANTTANGAGMQGVTLRYEFDLLTQGNQLLARVARIQTNPEARTLPKSFLGGAVFVSEGGDLITWHGTVQAFTAADGTPQAGSGAFGAVSLGATNYDTGSHGVEVDGAHLLSGVGTSWLGTASRLNLGAFFEAGEGRYDSGDAANPANGKTRYYGLGALGRGDFDGGTYWEASVRAGRMENELSGVISNTAVKFDSKSFYAGVHAGVGHIWQLSDQTRLDASLKYLWLRQNGDKTRLSSGEPLRFEAVNSHRLRLGARLSNAITRRASLYAGAAWEYEFDGKSVAKSHTYQLEAPDLKGGTGIGEAGFTLRPLAGAPLSVDVGIKYSAGVRDGIAGVTHLKYVF